MKRLPEVLLLGAGSRRVREWPTPGAPFSRKPVTLDFNEAHKPDVVHDLNRLPWPFAEESFDEIHAYDVLEHLGTQGDWRYFFGSFGEVARILRPGGLMVATVPWWQSKWAWGDPSHTRVITPENLYFLAQKNYSEVGKTAMSDFRFIWKDDLSTLVSETDGETFLFVLKKENILG